MKKTTDGSDLQSLPSIGPSLARDLRDLGFRSSEDLRGANPERMYADLRELRGTRIDPCVLYSFRCAVHAASTDDDDPELRKWWNWKDRLVLLAIFVLAGAASLSLTSCMESAWRPDELSAREFVVDSLHIGVTDNPGGGESEMAFFLGYSFRHADGYVSTIELNSDLFGSSFHIVYPPAYCVETETHRDWSGSFEHEGSLSFHLSAVDTLAFEVVVSGWFLRCGNHVDPWLTYLESFTVVDSVRVPVTLDEAVAASCRVGTVFD